MPDPQPSSTTQLPPAPRRPRLGWGWLVLSGLILGCAALLFFAPELPRQWLGGGTQALPKEAGPEPAVPPGVSGGPAGRDAGADLAGLGKVQTWRPPLETGTPVKQPTVTDRPGYGDDGKARPLLAEAEAAYKGFRWEAAESSARKIAGLDASPQIKGRALEIARGAPALKRLFAGLDDRDELVRGFDTSPGLLILSKGGGGDLPAVPIRSMDNLVPIEDGALAYVEKVRRAGKVALLIKGTRQFSPAEMSLDGYTVVQADTAPVRRERLVELERRLRTLRDDRSAKKDPIQWYEAGKFAYRNRLDEQVTALLDQALSLDPFLDRTVRERAAGGLYAAMIVHMKNGNKMQAAGFMSSIRKRYGDTDTARQAQMYYDGRTQELLAARRAEEEKAKAEEEARLKARLEIAEAKQDEQAVEDIKSEAKAPPPPEIAAPVEEPGPADEPVDAGGPSTATGPSANDPKRGKADRLFADGFKLYSEAMNMPPGPERTEKYHKAADLLGKAKWIYNDLVGKYPKDEALEMQLGECSQAFFGAKKYASAW
jgi:hypothetical protein